jgi:SAM-dependent methyltransferase
MTAVLRQTRLNIGCGKRPLADAVNLDISDRVGADVVHDLNFTPWPFADSTFDEVQAFDVLEHLNDVVRALEEIHRISRHGATVHVTIPHFSSANAFTDVTHRHWFGWRSFDPFVEVAGNPHELAHYSQARFRCSTARIHFHPSLVNKLIWRCANRWPLAYEHRWAWMFPAWFMSVRLEVVKDAR